MERLLKKKRIEEILGKRGLHQLICPMILAKKRSSGVF